MIDNDRFDLSRSELLLGRDSIEKLSSSAVMVCGLGGVGSYAFEAVVRSGVGRIIAVDADIYTCSNLNRQLYATQSSLGLKKADVAAARAADINPGCEAIAENIFLSPDNVPALLEKYRPDYVIDAVDNVTAKISLITSCSEKNIPIISCMGTGNKLDPSKFQITDIYETSVCPLAKVMRHELRKRNVAGVPVLFSTEEPIPAESRTVGSVSFVPSSAGLMLAGFAVKQLIRK